MLKLRAKSFISLIVISTLFTCIDPYVPKLKGYDSLLVVDGLITDENTSYSIRLSRTFQQQDASPDMISDATVFISDDLGTEFDLKSTGNGIYKSDSTIFRGSAGKTYVLHAVTSDGELYESDPCLMQPVPEIDSIYFKKDQDLANNKTEALDGIRIYLDSQGSDNNFYYRWDFEEIWRFRVPIPRSHVFIDETNIPMIADVREYCWKTGKSNDIIIHEIYPGEPRRIENEPIYFIATAKSDRLLVEYSIMIKQYSLSKNEYDFWNNLKQINEAGGDIFAKQPFTVISNIHSLKNPEERVLGYFQVSAVKQRRKNISFNEIANLNLPYFNYNCEKIEYAPWDSPWNNFKPPMTWYDLWYMYTSSGYYFVEPKYDPATHDLVKLVFAKPECADCEVTGTLKEPDFPPGSK